MRKTYSVKNYNVHNVTQEQLENTFNKISNWMDQMRLKLNTNKTEYIQFGSRQELKKIETTIPFNADVDLIQMSNVFRYLGGYMDCNLNFKEHVSQKIKKAMTNFTSIRSIRRFISMEASTTLVLMLCESHLDYGNLYLWTTQKSIVYTSLYRTYVLN